MFTIDKDNAITLTRGDSMQSEVVIITIDGDEYVPQEGDSLRFALKANRMTVNKGAFINPEPLIEKSISTNDLILRLVPEDTKDLPFGKYVYDVELTFADGYVDTFINCAPFDLKPEVD